MTHHHHTHIRPLGNRVIVKRVDEEQTSKGGIIIPEYVREKQNEGIVIAVGPGKVLPNGRRLEPSVKAGDRVVFGKFAGYDAETKVDGDQRLFITEDDILYVVEP